MKTAPTGTSETFTLAMHFLSSPRPARRLLPGEPLPPRHSILDELDFGSMELLILAKISGCEHRKFETGFCTNCGLNKPGIEAFEEFLKTR